LAIKAPKKNPICDKLKMSTFFATGKSKVRFAKDLATRHKFADGALSV
jgi:hypothetical protein